MPPESSDPGCWFSVNVLPHEPALRAWLRKRFPDADNVDDIIQDAYLRILKVRESNPIRSPKNYLFRTARNLSLDHLKRRKIFHRIVYEESSASDVIDASTEIRDTVSRNQSLEIMKAAIQSLPKRCRQVVTLHEVYGMPQKDIAKKLGISPSTVSDQVAIGIQKCTAFAKKYRNEGNR